VKITFYSNFLNHHQLPFCQKMTELIGDNFTFVATEPIAAERLAMNYEDINKKYPFVLRAYESEEKHKKAHNLAEQSDIVIIGSAPEEYLKNRLKNNKIVFRYLERIFKTGRWHILSPRVLKYLYLNHFRYRNNKMFLLCASAYTAGDFAIAGLYKNKTLKWGYFPEVKNYDIKELMAKKNNNVLKILWAGRLVAWKHTNDAIKVVKRLKDDGYSFSLDIIGSGDCEENLKKFVIKNNLSNEITFLGSMSPENVREYMENANIFLFTSDFQEGWGAVLNEAMNSGCAVVASDAIGSVPYLLEHGKNGLIYKYGNNNDFYNKVKFLMDNIQIQKKLGQAAYETLSQTWNATVAAERFFNISTQVLECKKLELYTDGPLSKA